MDVQEVSKYNVMKLFFSLKVINAVNWAVILFYFRGLTR
jgi:hypothetical protein